MNTIQTTMHKLVQNKALLYGLVLVSVVLVAGATYMVRGNSDYICSYVVEDEQPCAVDSWSEWEDTGTNPDPAPTEPGAVYTVYQKRVGSGTKLLSTTIQYWHRRTACPKGFTQTYHGKSGGASGFIDDGNQGLNQVYVTVAACQVEGNRTVRRTNPTEDPNGGEIGDPTNEVIDEGTGPTIIGEISTTTVDDIESMDDVTRIRRQMVEARIEALPPIVRSGTETQLRWRSVETKYCDVSGSNGDVWTHTDNQKLVRGNATSSPITAVTTYTLNCVDFEGNPVSAQTEVKPVANWKEE